jgi:twitching motility protein PilT
VDLSIALPKIGRFRVNVFKQRQQVAIALRVIPREMPSISSLGLPIVLSKLAHAQRGLILLTGVTGSGKSTTLAAMVEEINQSAAKHIITIEDPIEFSFSDSKGLISQREIGVDCHSFSNALRAALRQDPDVILISEIRDKETMEIALSAAETGHLVMASLHSINASEAITRIVDFYEIHHQQAVRHLLSGTLTAIVSQRLVPLKKGGRIAAVEVMLNRGAVSECIENAARTKEIHDFLTTGTAQYGTQSFDQALFWHHQDGLISEENALLFSDSPEDLKLRFAGIAGEDWSRPT